MVSTGFTDAVVSDTDLIRIAVREGWVERRLADDALMRCSDASAALADLIVTGALDRQRLTALRQRLAIEQVPKSLGSWRLRDVLGHGGMGIVYRAIGDDGSEVALKVLPFELSADAKIERRFRREAEAASALRHPRIVATRGIADDHGRLYIVMELMRGGNVEELVERVGGLPWRRAAGIARDAAAGLEAVHAAGLIHRDVKPANLFLDEDGRAKLGDFGIVRAAGAADGLTEPGRAIGTLGFMAPEQVEATAAIDPRADLYAVGATLFYALTGRAPFVGDDNGQILSQVLSRPLPDPRDLVVGCPADLAAIVRGAGALRREERYADAAGLRADLDLVLAGQPPRHVPPPASATTVIVRRDRGREAVHPGVRRALAAAGGPAAGAAPPLRALREVRRLVERMQQSDPREGPELRELARALPPLAAWAEQCGSPFTAALLGATDALVRQLDSFTHHLNQSSLRTLAASFARAQDLIERRLPCPPLDQVSALVVDDDLISRKTMCQALRKVGLRAEATAGPAQALELLSRGNDVGLVLSDVLMTGFNGFQFAARLRAEPRYRSLPIVFVTMLSDFDKVFAADTAGITDVIAKPFLLMELAVKALTHLVPDPRPA